VLLQRVGDPVGGRRRPWAMSPASLSISASTSASLPSKYWYSEPTLTPAISAMRTVVVWSSPYSTSARPVASIRLSTSCRERRWRGCLRMATPGVSDAGMRIECEYIFALECGHRNNLDNRQSHRSPP
jgi:hypothetical protein